MTLAIRARGIAAIAAVGMIFTASAAIAQEISESHLKAARAAISALKATAEFDAVLPQAAGALKVQLTQKNPDMMAIISSTIDEKTLALASRRADLEREVANIYAKVFSEQQLNEIAAFYNTETGKKLMSDGDIVGRETLQAASIWQRGIGRDLAQQVGEQLAQITKAQGAAAPAPAPVAAQPAAPAAQPAKPAPKP